MIHGEKPAPLHSLDLSKDLRALLEACWHEDTTKRPDAAACRIALVKELNGPTSSGLPHFSGVYSPQSNIEGGLPPRCLNYLKLTKCFL